jgi:hypothetical protein
MSRRRWLDCPRAHWLRLARLARRRGLAAARKAAACDALAALHGAMPPEPPAGRGRRPIGGGPGHT